MWHRKAQKRPGTPWLTAVFRTGEHSAAERPSSGVFGFLERERPLLFGERNDRIP